MQVGSHYHFYETNPALDFDREATLGMRLDIPSGTAVRFEPGQQRDVLLIPFGGNRHAYGFNQKVMGALCTRAIFKLCLIMATGPAMAADWSCSDPDTLAATGIEFLCAAGF